MFRITEENLDFVPERWHMLVRQLLLRVEQEKDQRGGDIYVAFANGRPFVVRPAPQMVLEA